MQQTSPLKTVFTIYNVLRQAVDVPCLPPPGGSLHHVPADGFHWGFPDVDHLPRLLAQPGQVRNLRALRALRALRDFFRLMKKNPLNILSFFSFKMSQLGTH